MRRPPPCLFLSYFPLLPLCIAKSSNNLHTCCSDWNAGMFFPRQPFSSLLTHFFWDMVSLGNTGYPGVCYLTSLASSPQKSPTLLRGSPLGLSAWACAVYADFLFLCESVLCELNLKASWSFSFPHSRGKKRCRRGSRTERTFISWAVISNQAKWEPVILSHRKYIFLLLFFVVVVVR